MDRIYPARSALLADKDVVSMMVEPMNWISEVVRPKIKTLFKRETPENLWVKCPDTGQMVFHKEVEGNLWVIPGSEHHLKMSAQARLKMMFDEATWIDVPLPTSLLMSTLPPICRTSP